MSISPDDLPESIAEVIRATQRSETPDYSKYRVAGKDTWQDLVEGENCAEYVRELVRKCLLLPRGDFQWRIVASYLMLPSALCTSLPILFSHGLSGSGKSNLGYLACGIHNALPISAGSTFASLRNIINAARWHSPELGDVPGNEKHAVLIWEDIAKEELLRQDKTILALLKNGVNRDGVVTVAVPGGAVSMFKVFSPKYVSSIHPLYSHYDFRELIRRMIVVQHKPVSRWLKDDYSEFYQGIEPPDLVEPQDIDWTGFNLEFNQFWGNPAHLEMWSSVTKSVSRKKKHGMPDANYKISRNLITCGVVCNYWATIDEAIDSMRQYWQWHEDNIESQVGATQKVLKRFIDECVSRIDESNSKAKAAKADWALQDYKIEPKAIKVYLSACASEGELDTGTTPKEVSAAMNNLGWHLTLDSQGKTHWMLIES